MVLSNERPAVTVFPEAPRVSVHEGDLESEREFHAFVLEKEPALRRGIVRALRLLQQPFDAAEIEEQLQEVYCRLLSARARRITAWRERKEAPCEAYLSRLAERSVFDQIRRAEAAKRRPRRPIIAIDELPRAVVLRCPRPSVEAVLLARERRGIFWRGLLAAGGLVGRDSERMVALAIAGKGSREIAAALKHRVKASSIDTLLHRFRRRLADQGIELPHRSRTPARACFEPALTLESETVTAPPRRQQRFARTPKTPRPAAPTTVCETRRNAQGH